MPQIGIETGKYTLPKFNLGLGKAPLAQLFGLGGSQSQISPEVLALVESILAKEGGGTGMLSAPIAQGAPTMGPPPPPPVATEGGGIFDNYLKTWQDPNFALNFPAPRGPDQTGLQNVRNGLLNATVNLPQNLTNAYQEFIGKPFAGAVGPVVNDMWNFFTKPEGEVAAEKAAAAGGESTPPPAFTPGLPTGKIAQVESGGNPTARNPSSSAVGTGQFLKGTWLEFMKEVHPDTLDTVGEAAALDLRNDPKWSEEATSWYAGKAVDILDDLNLPSTDANIYLHHFLGPNDFKKVLTADPNTPIEQVVDAASIRANPTIFKKGMTVADIQNWAAVKMGEAEAQPPTPRPDVVMPDFSQANAFLDAARPQPVPEQMLKEAMFAEMLSGIGQGLSAPISDGGDLFGNLAAGSGIGLRQGKELQLKLQQDFQNQLASYNMTRAGVAGDQEGIRVAGQNAQNTTSWENAEDKRKFQQEQSALNAAKKAPRIIESSADGIWVQNPDGSIQHISADDNSQLEQLETVAKALGEDSQTARQLKYNVLSTTPGTNLLSFQMEIARDVIKDGMGPAVFGDAYTEALAAAEDMIPPALQGDAKAYSAALEKTVTGLLLGGVQSSGDTNWILQAATLGNPGAAILLQNGKMQ